MQTPQALVVGPSYLDVVAAPLKSWPRLGTEVITERVEIAAGGFAIAAIALRRLGIAVTLGTVLGDDRPGAYLASQIAAEGIERVGPNADSTAVTLALNGEGDRAFVTAGPPQGDVLARAGAAAFAARPGARWLHLSGRGFWAAAVAREARRRGMFISLDCGTDAAWLASEAFKDILGLVDIYLPNALEATLVTGTEDLRAAARVLGELVPAAIVKLGAGGVLQVRGQDVRHEPALPQTPVDTTGAGDVFDAGYIAGRLYGFSEDEATALGQFAAGQALRALGGATAAPGLAECRAALPDLPWPA